MEVDGAELMKDGRRRQTVEGRFGRDIWRMEKLLKEANGIGKLLVWLWWCGMHLVPRQQEGLEEECERGRNRQNLV